MTIDEAVQAVKDLKAAEDAAKLAYDNAVKATNAAINQLRKLRAAKAAS